MKQRLDLYLVKNKSIKSRNLAQSLITNRAVLINGVVVEKSNYLVGPTDNVDILNHEINKYVSRGGLKLEHALNTFNYKVSNLVVMDVGASTGGFTDCLLKAGANKVFAIDVGSNQLAPELKTNPNVISLEKQNFRDFNFEVLNDHVDLIVIDVSFISLGLIFDNIYRNLKKLDYSEMTIIALIKPEFELDRHALTKTGVVKSNFLEKQAILKVIDKAKNAQLSTLRVIASPLLGAKAGNREFLGLFQYKKSLENDKITSLVNIKNLVLEASNDSTNND